MAQEKKLKERWGIFL